MELSYAAASTQPKIVFKEAFTEQDDLQGVNYNYLSGVPIFSTAFLLIA
jgi:hypothetical protein